MPTERPIDRAAKAVAVTIWDEDDGCELKCLAVDNQTEGGIETRMAKALMRLFGDATPDGVGHLIAAKVLAEMRTVLGIPAAERREVRR